MCPSKKFQTMRYTQYLKNDNNYNAFSEAIFNHFIDKSNNRPHIKGR